MSRLRSVFLALLLLSPICVYHHTSNASAPLSTAQTTSVKFKDENPVVNEGNKITLSITDSTGQIVTGYTFESGSPDIATVDPVTGEVTGVTQGYATVTAKSGSNSISTFVVVSRVQSATGAQVAGDSVVDASGAVYISDPLNHVILKKEVGSTATAVYAGKSKVSGRVDGTRTDALFSGPVGVAVDNRSQGGVYIADTLNHSIRRVGFDDQVTTILGKGTPGTITADSVPLSEAVFKGPRGVAVDSNGTLYIADTENHAIYSVDFTTQQVKLLAGNPGVQGKTNGKGRAATFSRPAAITISSASTSSFGSSASAGLFVADTGNDRIRFVTFTGQVTTVGKIGTSSIRTQQEDDDDGDDDGDDDDNGNNGDDTGDDDGDGCDDQFDDCGDDNSNGDGDPDGDGFDDNGEVVFDDPLAVTSDDSGNIYIVDDKGVSLIVNLGGQLRVVPLAQRAVSFVRPRGIDIVGTQAFVLDGGASTEQALKIVTVGEPSIVSLSRDSDRIEGGSEVSITGKNFAPESIVILGDQILDPSQYRVVSATEIRFTVPAQSAPGRRTLTVQTRGGIAQTSFNIISTSLLELSDGEITTLAGGVPFLGDGGRAVSSRLNAPTSIVIDSDGRFYIADSLNRRVRRIDTSKLITTIAGNGNPGFSGDGGSAIVAGLDNPVRVALGVAGELFIADQTAGRVRRVNLITGVITTVAGNGVRAFTGDNISALEAGLDPAGIAVDSSGNLYVADRLNNRVRRVDRATGLITTVAGNGQRGFSGDGDKATLAALNLPVAIAFDPKGGNLHIVDQGNHRVRRVDSQSGIITTIAGNGTAAFSGDRGPATAASLNSPSGISFDRIGNILIADKDNGRIRSIDTRNGQITTLAGTGDLIFQKEGVPPTEASFQPSDVIVDGLGNIFIADSFNNRVFRIEARGGSFVTFAGNDESLFVNDEPIPSIRASFNLPEGVSIDSLGNILIADTGNHRIRLLDLKTGLVSTLAGNGKAGVSADDTAALNSAITPTEVGIDRGGSILFTDLTRVRRIDNRGALQTVAGQPVSGFSGDGGLATAARLNNPGEIAVDPAGNIFIADNNNFRIRRIDARTGQISTYAGTGNAGFSGDGGAADRANLAGPFSLAVDRMGNLFIADRANNRVRVVDANSRVIRTVAGNGSATSSGDGLTAVNAGISAPTAVALDEQDNLYIGEQGAIRRVLASNSTISTIAGIGIAGYSGDGSPATSATLFSPSKMLVDKAGNLIFTDTFNNALRVVKNVTGVTQSNGFTLSVDKTLQTVAPGGTAKFIITASPFGSFSAPIEFSARTVPESKENIRFLPASILPGNSTEMTVQLSPETTLTSLDIIIIGRSGGIVRSQTVTLRIGSDGVSDFSLSVNPTSATIRAGEAASFTVAVQAEAGQTVSLSAVSNPTTELRVGFEPSIITAGNNSRMTVTAPAGIASGQVQLTITGSAGQVVRSTTLLLDIQGNSPPEFLSIEDQTVSTGQVLTLPVAATDPNGNTGLRLSIASAPSYVTLEDRGLGVGSLRIAPQASDLSGSVTLLVTDPGGLTGRTSFNVTVRVGAAITTINYTKPSMVISGVGFGTSGARVTINATDVTARVRSQNDTTITLNGNKKKLALKKGENDVVVTTASGLSATAKFNF